MNKLIFHVFESPKLFNQVIPGNLGFSKISDFYSFRFSQTLKNLVHIIIISYPLHAQKLLQASEIFANNIGSFTIIFPKNQNHRSTDFQQRLRESV